MNSSDRNMRNLIDQYFTDELTEQELATLEARLSENVEWREEFLQHGSLHIDLQFAMRAEKATAGMLRGMASDATAQSSPKRHWWPLAIAASVLLLLGASAWVATVRNGPIVVVDAAENSQEASATLGETVATLYYASDCIWKDAANESLANGASLRNGQSLALQAGLAEVVYISGVHVVVEGPADFDLFSSSELNLKSGRVTAKVPEGAIGFCVNTPATKVVDLGTEFGVSADDNGSADVEVFTGQVLVSSPTNDDLRQLLSAGQAVRADRLGDVVGIEPAEIERPWVRHIERPTRSAKGTVIARYNRDFVASADDQPTPAPGWRYLWNPTAPVGEVAEYQDLLWNGKIYYVPFGTGAFPGPLPAAALLIGPYGGHPGPDLNVCFDRIERACIVSYTVAAPGRYAIAGSWLTRMVAARHDGYDNAVQLVIHDNQGQTLLEEVIRSNATINFDLPLGEMQAGESVYLAVLPTGSSSFDNFQWDFDIVRLDGVAPDPDAPPAQFEQETEAS